MEGGEMMGIAFVVVGLATGVWLNVAIERLPTRQALLKPWSRCDGCSATGIWPQLVPIVGFLWSRGRCSQCGAPLRKRQLVVEALTPALFAVLWARFGPSWELLVATAYSILFVVVLFIDLEHRLILNRVIYPSVIVAAAISPLWPELGLSKALVGGVVGFLVMLLPCLLGGMGGGDVKLAGLIGVMVGFPLVCVALVITILTGGLTASALMVLRRKGRKDTMAYGPFLAVAGVVTLLYGQPIWEWYMASIR